MGLSNSVKKFFVDKIQKTISEKINEQNNKIDKLLIHETSLDMLCDKLSESGKDKLSRLRTVVAEAEKLNERFREIKKGLDADIEEAGFGLPSYYVSDSIRYLEQIEGTAIQVFGDSATEIVYPEESKEIKRLQELMDDVEGTVLLSTTEPNLRMALTNLLERYGGDISGIENML